MVGKTNHHLAIAVSRPVGKDKTLGFALKNKDNEPVFVVNNFRGTAQEILAKGAQRRDVEEDPAMHEAFRQFVYEVPSVLYDPALQPLGPAIHRRLTDRQRLPSLGSSL